MQRNILLLIAGVVVLLPLTSAAPSGSLSLLQPRTPACQAACDGDYHKCILKESVKEKKNWKNGYFDTWLVGVEQRCGKGQTGSQPCGQSAHAPVGDNEHKMRRPW
ncbi:MAG: hypothetical protein JOS17DRAFT_780040 [Linnemannia elongata]|nr:MAG: hypothetical protein JOS17DRAFT_780040 [Linnemannia elongata]